MREIKFRFWDKSIGKFVKHPLIMYNGNLLHQDDMGQLTQDLDKIFVTQQYTGIKDRNGKEIYEGDIVKCEPAWFYQFEHSGEIYFSEERSGFFYKNDEKNINWNINNTFECEVIGNIYEQN